MALDYIEEQGVSANVTKRRVTLRSEVSNTGRLGQQKQKFGDLEFQTAESTVWNSLPASIRQSSSLE